MAGSIEREIDMRVTVTRKITAKAGTILNIDTYDISGLSLSGGLVSPSFASLISLEDIHEQIVNGNESIWVKGAREFKDSYGQNIDALEIGDIWGSEVVGIEVFG